ncbi:MAG: NF038143 family protein [Deltaproteobacteria bacterium]|jgi:hypothetical protein
MDKYDIILGAEQQFAREVSLGVIYLRPPSAWYYLIPGMFIFDFLRRSSTIRKYTETFMFPRKLALEGARSLLAGETRAAIDSHLEGKIKSWLIAHRLDSRDLVKAQKESVALLMDHYLKLLQAEGESYHDLIQQAYSSRENFEAHLQQIAAAENKVDQAILVKVGDNPAVKEKLQLEARQVESRRRKILEDIF